MTTEVEEIGAWRRQQLGKLGAGLERSIDWLQRGYVAGNNPTARADLARLRRGLGKPAGTVPEIWEITIGAVPEKLAGQGEKPSKAEQAAHVALTLYAVHQQSRTEPMHLPGVSFGHAVRRLASRPEVSDDAVVRRFMAVATAETVDELLVHVRGLINQLRANKIGLDYAAFADDVVDLLTPGQASAVRLRWGRRFYRTDASSSENENGEGMEDHTENANTENATEETGASA